MEQGYSKEDFAKMQQQAINRVREMQRQSKQTSEGEKKPPKDIPAFFKPEKTGPPQSQCREPEQKKETPPKKNCAPPPAIKRVYTKSKPNTAPFFEMDSDIALILPLLLLLQRDGADEMLILALLYIMS